MIGFVAVACAVDAGYAPQETPPYQQCAEDWQERDVPPPDGNWFACATEYCFDGKWIPGDQCPSNWFDIGWFGPKCRQGCAVALPCKGWFGAPECCNVECADAMPPDAEPDGENEASADQYVAGDARDEEAEVETDAMVDGGTEEQQ